VKLVLASNNPGKLREIREILAGSGIGIVSQREAGCDFEAEETGSTFLENARIKALAAMRATGLPAAADDSGLEVAALGGAPGIYSARYGGKELPYPEKCARLLAELADKRDRSARFVAFVVCEFPDGRELAASGELRGAIAAAPRGGNGFGYDPIFVPEGYERTAAELPEAEKNAISHRGKAFRALARELARLKEDGSV